MATTRLSITGMTCQHCHKKVEDALKTVPGVYAAFVDLDAGTAEVDSAEGTAGPEVLTAAVAQAGYAATVAT